jgi:hypothetical protein
MFSMQLPARGVLLSVLWLLSHLSLLSLLSSNHCPVSFSRTFFGSSWVPFSHVLLWLLSLLTSRPSVLVVVLTPSSHVLWVGVGLELSAVLSGVLGAVHWLVLWVPAVKPSL